MGGGFSNGFSGGFGSKVWCEALVMLVDSPTLATHPTGAYRRGDIVVIKPVGHPGWSASEGPPTFCKVKIRLGNVQNEDFLRRTLTKRREMFLDIDALSQQQKDQLDAGEIVELLVPGMSNRG